MTGFLIIMGGITIFVGIITLLRYDIAVNADVEPT